MKQSTYTLTYDFNWNKYSVKERRKIYKKMLLLLTRYQDYGFSYSCFLCPLFQIIISAYGITSYPYKLTDCYEILAYREQFLSSFWWEPHDISKRVAVLMCSIYDCDLAIKRLKKNKKKLSK